MNATLRNQLSGRDASEADPRVCYTLIDQTRGIKFCTGRRTIAFPYSHVLYWDLIADDTLAVRFSTHRILVLGEHVEMLVDELVAQRLFAVRVLPKRYRESATAGPWIERIDVVEIGRLNHTATGGEAIGVGQKP